MALWMIMLPRVFFAGPELVNVLRLGYFRCAPHVLLLKGKRCINVLEEQYIYDVMMGAGLMILIF
jgi:hypothetical protein